MQSILQPEYWYPDVLVSGYPVLIYLFIARRLLGRICSSDSTMVLLQQ